jgi:hypothetical protein
MRPDIFLINAMDIIEHKRVQGISIGDAVESMENAFRPIEFGKGRLGRRLKLCYHSYGNLSFVSDNDIIISIDLDFHGAEPKIVDLVSGFGGFDEWIAFFNENGWNIQERDDIISANCNGVYFSFFLSGEMEMVSIQ